MHAGQLAIRISIIGLIATAVCGCTDKRMGSGADLYDRLHAKGAVTTRGEPSSVPSPSAVAKPASGPVTHSGDGVPEPTGPEDRRFSLIHLGTNANGTASCAHGDVTHTPVRQVRYFIHPTRDGHGVRVGVYSHDDRASLDSPVLYPEVAHADKYEFARHCGANYASVITYGRAIELRQRVEARSAVPNVEFDVSPEGEAAFAATLGKLKPVLREPGEDGDPSASSLNVRGDDRADRYAKLMSEGGTVLDRLRKVAQALDADAGKPSSELMPMVIERRTYAGLRR